MKIFKYYICIICKKIHITAGEKKASGVCCNHRLREITKEDYKRVKKDV